MATGESKDRNISLSSPPPVAKRKGAFLLDKKLIETLLSERHVLYRRDFAKIFGGVCPGLFLSQLFYWMGRGEDEDGWIYKTMEEWSDETGMSRKEIERARRILREAEVLEEKRGVSKLYYRVNMDVLIEKLGDGSNRPNGAVRDVPFERSEESDSDISNITKITHKPHIKKKDEPPEGDLRKSPPAQREEEDRSRDVFNLGPASKHPDLEKLSDEDLHKQGYFRTYAGQIKKKAAAGSIEMFKSLANGIPSVAGIEEENEAKTVRYNCKGCGEITEFPSDDDAMDGKCEKCGEPIFKEEEMK